MGGSQMWEILVTYVSSMLLSSPVVEGMTTRETESVFDYIAVLTCTSSLPQVWHLQVLFSLLAHAVQHNRCEG